MKYLQLFEEFINSPKVCMYFGYGVRQDTVIVWSNFFREFFATEPKIFQADGFTRNNLKDFDLVVIPGGKGEKEMEGLTMESKQELKKWVHGGGKILGVCGGAILITQCYEWSLGLVPLTHNQKIHKGIVDKTLFLDYKFTDAGREIFGTSLEKATLYYHWGPVMYTNGDCEVLLTFDSYVPQRGDIPNFGIGKVAAGYSRYGQGHALAISPHIEKSEDYKYLLQNAINYLIGK